MDSLGRTSFVEYLEEKSVGGETAHWVNSRLHPLVMERASHLAKAASKLAVRCYSKSGSACLHSVHNKIIVERGV
jgi:hypothetical protein